MKNLFIIQGNVRNAHIRAKEKKNTVRYGLEIICYRNPCLYASLPKECMLPNLLSKSTEKNKEQDMWGICMQIMGYL